MRWLAVVVLFQLSCVHSIERVVSPKIETVDRKAPFLKVHMRNGDLFVLSSADVDNDKHEIIGEGELFGPDRLLVRDGVQRIPMADVALYETNTISTSASVGVMAVVTGLSVAVTVACLTNPKACFGSCPTFYAPGEPDAHGAPTQVLQAEGFSDAIAPALETHDIDALWRTHVTNGHLRLRMTSEAYETHVVKAADILAVPRQPLCALGWRS